MTTIRFATNSVDTDKLAVATSRLLGQYEWIAARAMTRGVQGAKQQIERQIFPMIEGGPTRWTRRGLIARYAKRNDLRAAVGFNYDQDKFSKDVIDKLSDSGMPTFKGGGVPSGRYMGIGARGGNRVPKSFERQLRASGIIPANGFVVPNKNLQEIDTHGNLPAKMYTQIGSRIRGLSTPGSTQNAPRGPGSRNRTARKRKESDYFVFSSKRKFSSKELAQATREVGGDSRLARFILGGQRQGKFIARRVGREKRGFEPVLWFKNNISYPKRFPIQPVAWKEFERIFPVMFRRGVQTSLMKRRFD